MAKDVESPRASFEKLTFLERAISVATEVRPGEGLGALLLGLDVFLLLTAYYLIKPVREALILSGGGAEVKSYAAAGQMLLLSIAIPFYGRLVERVSRQKLIPGVTLFFIGCLVLFYAAVVARVPHVGVAFFLFVGIFNVTIVAQFWAYAADLYRAEQGERLFPVVALGGSIGAVFGSGFASQLAENFAPALLLLIAAFVLFVTVITTVLIERAVLKSPNAAEPHAAEPHAAEPHAAEPHAAEPHAVETRSEEQMASMNSSSTGGSNPFLLVFRNKYLLLISGLMLLANVVNTTGEFVLGSVVSSWAEQEALNGGAAKESTIAVFYGEFFFWVNLVGLLVQLLLVSRVIHWIGVRGALLVLPVVALSSYLAIALFPLLALVRWVKIAENATDYSLNNTVRNALFLPVSREEKYKAKQVIDTFFVRGGDVASAALVATGLHVFAWDVAGFAWFNFAAVSVWLFFALAIGHHYAKLTARSSEESPAAAARADVAAQ